MVKQRTGLVGVLVGLALLFAANARAQTIGPNGSGTSSGSSLVMKATVTLTAAQIKALDLTPLTVIAAPGAGKAIQLIAPPFMQYKFGTLRYVTQPIGTVNLAFNYGSVDTVAPTLNIGLVTDTNGTTVFSAAASGNASLQFNSNQDPIPQPANQPLIIGISNPNKISYNCGPITVATVAVAGSGYAVNDTFNIDPNGVFNGDTNDATGHVTSIGAGGSVTGVAINAAGTSYLLTTANVASGPYPTVHTSGVGNDALTLNVTGVTAGDGTAVVTVLYQIVTLQ